MLNNFLHSLKNNIKQGEHNSPCLFLWTNLELNNSKVKEIALELLEDFSIPKSYLYILEDNWESIKIKEIKEFIKFSESKSPYKFQIFFIENISRLTLSASNSLLKILEEPWKQNIFFLSSMWENNILDTVLSRVNIINLWWNKNLQKDIFYSELIENYKRNNDNEIIQYFYKAKLEKEEYIKFLENLIIYFKENIWSINSNLLLELDDDINWIKQNNLFAKNIVDKWLMII
jgi:DNA polymerase III delta prime subunit